MEFFLKLIEPLIICIFQKCLKRRRQKQQKQLTKLLLRLNHIIDDFDLKKEKRLKSQELRRVKHS